MAKKLTMIDFHILMTNQPLQEKMTDQYLKKDGNGMA